jgi:NADPH:quinone reductase-like Zn-dependent oxidoreductase
MKAFVVDGYKSKDGLRAVDLTEPEVGPGDVLVRIRIHAAGVNPLDSKVANGEFKLMFPNHFPLVLGHDLAGVVVRVASRVRAFEAGDEVYARAADGRIGTFADLVAISESDLARKPATLTMNEAASIPLAALTAWQALVERVGVTRGQKVLIHAGSGGVGTIAIQLAKHLGATVATTTSTVNVDLVKGLGADVVIDYKDYDFETMLDGYDVVLDPLGAKHVEKSLKVLKPGGIAIGIAGPPDPAFAEEFGLNGFLKLAMGRLSARVRSRHAAAACGTRSSTWCRVVTSSANSPR